MSSHTENPEPNFTHLDEIVPHKRILIVDDDDIVRGLHETVLSRAGYGTHSAADGEEALALLDGDEFDLILTDRNMPRLGGVGLVRAIRAAGNRIPVVMVSGSMGHENLPRDIEREIAAALPKPARTSEVLAAIAGALRERSAEPAMARNADLIRTFS